MVGKKRHSPWIWIPMLFVAQEIPCAVVTYVALLMFLQFDASIGMAGMFSGLLWLPWILKSYFRTKVRKQGYFKIHIHAVEALLFLNMMGIATYMNYVRVNLWVLFLMLFLLSSLCAWHELLSRMYYNRMLYPRQQRIFNKTKTFVSQSTIILAYGVLIIIAGFFEVFFRSYQKAWAMESSLLAGVFLVFFALNFTVLQNPRIHNPYRYESLIGAFKNEMQVMERIRKKSNVGKILISLFFLLLPQALMFNGRVFFLLASIDDGGLDCTIQDVGFAQGTIGVIAFTLGIQVGRRMIERYGTKLMFWPFSIMLTLSPLLYMFMSHNPLVGHLPAICSMTFLAQLFFGFGLNACTDFVSFISEQRYRNSSSFLYIPLVAIMMILPMILSGWLVELLGYKMYFIVDVALAPLAWLMLILLQTKKLLQRSLNSDKQKNNKIN